MTLKIITYNIRGAKGTDRLRNYSRIGAFLKMQKIDIALIQEMDTRPPDISTEQDIADLQAGHFTSFVAAPTITKKHGWYGNAILSVYPVLKSQIIDISNPRREPRNILEVFIETPRGQLHVVNTHKGLQTSERTIQMRNLSELLSHKSEVPLIVGGDLNQWNARSEPLEKLNTTLHPLVSGPTFPTYFPLLQLDRMWCRPKSIVQSYQILKTPETRIFSDHYPVVAEIKL